MSTWAKCTHCLLLVQHNSQIADGVSGLTSALEAMGKQGITMVYSKTHQVLAHGDFALAVSEGLAHEMAMTGAKLQVKVLAPASTKTDFAKTEMQDEAVTYGDDSIYFSKFNTAEEMADFLYQLYASDKVVGMVDYEQFTLSLLDPQFNHLYHLV